MPNKKKTLFSRKQSFICIAIFISLIILVGGMLFYLHDANQLRSEKYNELRAISALKRSDIRRWLDDRKAEAMFLSTNPAFIQHTKSLLSGQSAQQANDYFQSRLSVIQHSHNYQNIRIISADNTVLFSLLANQRQIDSLDIEYITACLQSQKILISGFHIRSHHTGAHIDIVAPIIDEQDKPIAVLNLHIDPEAYLFPFIQTWPTPSKTAETLILREDKGSVLFLNELRHQKNTAMKLRIPLSEKKVPAVQAILGYEGIFEGVDYRGKRVLSDVRKIPGTRWYMISKVDKNEIFGDLYVRSIRILLFVFVLLLFSSTLIALIYNYKQRRIYKKLYSKEKELLEYHQEYQTTVYSIGDAVITTDVKGNVRKMNPIAAQLTGWSEKEATGKPLMEICNIIDGQSRTQIDNPVPAVLQKGEKIEVLRDIILISKSGTEIPISNSIAPIKDNDGKTTGVVLALHDHSCERAAQHALQESEEKYRTLVESSTDAIFVIQGKKITYLNQAACTLLKIDNAQQMIGKSLYDKIQTVDQSIHDYISSISKNPSKVFNFEANVNRLDGKYVATEITASAFQLKDELAIQVIMRDITARKNIESEKEKLSTQLMQSQKMDAVGKLAGGIAHDFNNMLNVITGYSELALEMTEKESPVYEDLQRILEASEKSTSLTRQLLAFARKQSSKPQIVNINETIKENQKMLQRLVGEDINFKFFPGENIWEIKVDISQMDQLFMNLATNARDAIPTTGTIGITIQNVIIDKRYSDIVPDLQPGEYVKINFSDTGVGIPHNLQSKIFDPFFTTKEKGKGTGLGLSTVYGIVKQNNGTIIVYSEPNQGTVFKIYFPRCVEKIIKTKTIKPETNLIGTETILVVEDEKKILDMCKSILENNGYTVYTAESPEKAFEIIDKYKIAIHLLITDVIMPMMNGRELNSLICQHQPNIKTLFMSGYTSDVVAHRGLLDDDMHYIQKPFNQKDFLSHVRNLLDNI